MFWDVEHIPRVGDIVRLSDTGASVFYLKTGTTVEVIAVRDQHHPYAPNEIAVVPLPYRERPYVFIIPLKRWEQYGEIVPRVTTGLKLSWDVHTYVQNEDGSGPRIYMTHFSKTVEKDSFEHGCDPDTSRYIIDEQRDDKWFNTYEDMREWLIERFGFPDNEWWTAFGEGEIITSQQEDGEGDEVKSTDPLYERFRTGEINLWAADYYVHFHFETEDGEEYQPEEEETARLFGIKNYGAADLKFPKLSLKISAIEPGATVTLRADIPPELKEQLQMTSLLDEPGRYYQVTIVDPDDTTWVVAHPEWGAGSFTVRRADGVVLTLPQGLADQLFARYGSVRRAWDVTKPPLDVGAHVHIRSSSWSGYGRIFVGWEGYVKNLLTLEDYSRQYPEAKQPKSTLYSVAQSMAAAGVYFYEEDLEVI